MPSRNQVGNGSGRFVASRRIIRSMNPVGICVNTILKIIAPQLHAQSLLLREAMMNKYDWAQDLLRDDIILMQGRSIAFNRQTQSHTDSLGPYGEWTPLIGLGFSRGATIRLAGIKEILPFEPGTIIFIRGGETPHAIEAWQGGQRISIACFTHRVVWDEFKMDYPWSNPFPHILHVLTKNVS